MHETLFILLNFLLLIVVVEINLDILWIFSFTVYGMMISVNCSDVQYKAFIFQYMNRRFPFRFKTSVEINQIGSIIPHVAVSLSEGIDVSAQSYILSVYFWL